MGKLSLTLLHVLDRKAIARHGIERAVVLHCLVGLSALDAINHIVEPASFHNFSAGSQAGRPALVATCHEPWVRSCRRKQALRLLLVHALLGPKVVAEGSGLGPACKPDVWLCYVDVFIEGGLSSTYPTSRLEL